MFKPLQYRRLALIVLVVLAGFGWVLHCLFEIQIRRHRELLAKGRQFSETARVLEARRGDIRDRNGNVVAVSAPVKTVYLNLALCSNRLDQVARTLGPLLKVSPEELTLRVRACWQRASSGAGEPQKALLLRRNVPVAEWRAITTALELETFGLGTPRLTASDQAQLRKLRHRLLLARDAQVRLYPGGESLCQLLGFVSARTNGVGLAGVCGLERGCEQILAGKDGRCCSQRDVAGNELPACRSLYETPADGNTVVLTIDLRLQHIVEQTLAVARAKYRARGASAIVMDPRTGEILASACCPGFNPQSPGAAAPETWRNAVFMDMVEPGSIMKFITLAGALDAGLTTLDSGVYCEQGHFVINRVPVHDHAAYGLLTVRQGFAKSSNIAFAKVGLALGPQRFHCCLTNFGLARCPGVAFAAEATGRIERPQSWSTMTLTRAAFGQGVSVSQLQMAVAMCAIANEGRLMRPWVVGRIDSPQGRVQQQFRPQFVRSVVSPQTAQRVKEALKAVVSPEGTGALAALDRYTVAAKTGTAQKANSFGYQAGRYYSSMLGFFPADSPRVVIAVALDEPQNGYYAGTVAAPVFRSIAEQIAVCLDIPPDKPARAPASGVLARSTPAQAPPLRPATNRAPGEMLSAERTFASVTKP
jgi:cell division protein FtsI/penicillin-binding protein 2